ncbi:hypothetical protein CDAR_59811 [Caerostris darwini]|uniref:Uncharacterized protein n=1 Tax=Caerostris darwini TaxID=1538125 RepID=A0AAV4RRE5_9ARAC|nr:hypothetical protein CDAR_59811 [Caerostris darwini]
MKHFTKRRIVSFIPSLPERTPVFSLWNTKEPFLHPSRYQQVTHYLFSPFGTTMDSKMFEHSSRIRVRNPLLQTILPNQKARTNPLTLQNTLGNNPIEPFHLEIVTRRKS